MAPSPFVPQKKVKGNKALPTAPPFDPLTSKRRTRGAIPSETTPLGVGDWLSDKDILCWLNQELYHMKLMNHVRGLLQLLLSRMCLGGCKWLNLAPH